MIRPNLGMDAPPTEISVGGVFYPCNTDYRLWIEVMEKMRTNFYTNATTWEETLHNREALNEIEAMVFGAVLADEDPLDVMKAIIDFAKGYPTSENDSKADAKNEDETDAIAYDIGRDINLIILAIRDQTGIDLSYRRKEPFHWWEFLLEFKNLQDCHKISRIIQIRSYKGDDADMKKARAHYALDAEMSMDDKREFDKLEEMFGGF